MRYPFRDRVDAGAKLAGAVRGEVQGPIVVAGLPRGGVPVAAQIASDLSAPLDVIIVRKLGVPFQPELAMGAIGEDGIRVVNPRVVAAAGLDEHELEHCVRTQLPEVERRARLYRQGRPRVSLEGRTVVVVDDGLATGATARVACQIARSQGAEVVVLAVPVAPPRTVELLGDVADKVICLTAPASFYAVGQYYSHFDQTSDEEVVALLRHASDRVHADGHDRAEDEMLRDEDVRITVEDVVLGGHLSVPRDATALIVFAHGSGSSRHSPRNRLVANELVERGHATLLFDLLTKEEEADRHCVFDVCALGERLADVTRWVVAQPEVRGLPIGYFGASTGAAAALRAARDPDLAIGAVVSRGGRPDLACAVLPEVAVPTLLIVGGLDCEVVGLNEWALSRLNGEKRLVVVPGASHLFEEPGALEEVSRLAGEWFTSHLAACAAA